MNYGVRLLGVALLGTLILFGGCSSGKKVSRIDAEETVDLSGNWNDTDSRLVADEMIGDALSMNGGQRPWLMNFVRDKSKNPADLTEKVHRAGGVVGRTELDTTEE